MGRDTTKVNMGRRQMPRCASPTCRLRLDRPDDRWCRLCRRFAGEDVQVHGALEPRRASDSSDLAKE